MKWKGEPLPSPQEEHFGHWCCFLGQVTLLPEITRWRVVRSVVKEIGISILWVWGCVVGDVTEELPG